MAGEEPGYLRRVRELGCVIYDSRCQGPTEAHHATGRKGMGQRNHDHLAMGLCALHHAERHSLSGYFKGMNKAAVRAWEQAQVERLRRDLTGSDF